MAFKIRAFQLVTATSIFSIEKLDGIADDFIGIRTLTQVPQRSVTGPSTKACCNSIAFFSSSVASSNTSPRCEISEGG